MGLLCTLLFNCQQPQPQVQVSVTEKQEVIEAKKLDYRELQVPPTCKPQEKLERIPRTNTFKCVSK